MPTDLAEPAQPVGLAAAFARRGIHYGWAVAAVTFLTMLVTAGAVGAPGVLILPLQKEFGWATSEISSALAVRLLLFGLMAPFAAAFMNRFGVRPVALVALSLIAASIIGSFFMTQLWQLVLLWGFVLGFGTGLTAMVLGATVATRWFVQRRGLVVGLLTASTATGQLVFLPLLAALTEQVGWRAAMTFVLGMIALAAVGILALMRDRPADVGLAPFGATQIVPAPAQAASLGAMLASPIVALRDAAKTSTFWILFGTFFVCGLTTNGLIGAHMIAFCSDHGLPEVKAAGVLAMMGLFDLVGTTLSGWLTDRYDPRKLLFVYYLLRGLSLIWLPFTDFSLLTLTIFAVFYGLDWIATVPPTLRLTTEAFGERDAPVVFGWIAAGHQIGAATAAMTAGLLRVAQGRYLEAFVIAGATGIAAAAAALLVRRRAAETFQRA